jgi:hypothetical protein
MPQFVCVLRESRVSGKNAICNRRAEVVRERRRLDVLGAVEVKEEPQRLAVSGKSTQRFQAYG